MPAKYPYQGMGDERRKVMSDERSDGPDFYMEDRDSGINADPDEGPRDGVVSVKRMHPNHYIRKGSC